MNKQHPLQFFIELAEQDSPSLKQSVESDKVVEPSQISSQEEALKALEELGITTYLHVPSPSMLDSFLEQGARRFVFEGRESGGHVGPRSSFVLWQSMLDILIRAKL